MSDNNKSATPAYDCTVHGYRGRQAVRRIKRALRILEAHGDTRLDTEAIEDAAAMLEHRIDWVRERDAFAAQPQTSRKTGHLEIRRRQLTGSRRSCADSTRSIRRL